MSTHSVSLTVNGEARTIEVEPRRLLVHAIREDLGLTGTHVGCDTSNCGACTVHLDGQAVKSCTVLAVQADGGEITTIEGLGTEGNLHPVQEAFWEEHGLQCGYCTPGMIMASADLLRRNPEAQRGGGPPRAGGQPLPLHGLPQHRQGRAQRGRSVMSVADRAQAEKWVGRAMKRKEDPKLITGRGNYVEDISLAGHAVGLVRPLARGARSHRLHRHLGRRGARRHRARRHR